MKKVAWLAVSREIGWLFCGCMEGWMVSSLSMGRWDGSGVVRSLPIKDLDGNEICSYFASLLLKVQEDDICSKFDGFSHYYSKNCRNIQNEQELIANSNSKYLEINMESMMTSRPAIKTHEMS